MVGSVYKVEYVSVSVCVCICLCVCVWGGAYCLSISGQVKEKQS